MKKAVFLDRDGTLNIDHGYVHKIDDFQFIEGSIDALKALKEMGYLLVLVTNQSGIARGYFSEDQFLQLTEWMDWSLAIVVSILMESTIVLIIQKGRVNIKKTVSVENRNQACY